MSKTEQKRVSLAVLPAAVVWICTGAAQAGPPKDPPTKCAPDAVLVGSVCVDKYEASVWQIPATNPAGKSNAKLINKVRKGKATVADLTAGGAMQLGTTSDNYPCADNGQDCAGKIYAASVPGVTPSAFITWFQALEACTNSGKRLPSNAEWQAAANGTPDPGGDNGATDCNTNSTPGVTATGSRSSCVSARGAFDMVGNLWEWVADWVPAFTACPGWGSFSNDLMCLSGASTTTTGPAALLRGGSFGSGSIAGPLAISGAPPFLAESGVPPQGFVPNIGFRCAR